MSKLSANENINDEDDLSETLESFETRWKYAVFPAMIAFVILAGFGFYLIYGMLQRMEDLSADIHDMAGVITTSMPIMQGGIVGMSSRMQFIGEDLHGMRADMSQLSQVVQTTMPAMEGKVGDMSKNMENMQHATSSMANTTHNMGQNIWNMNRNFSKPLSMMRKIMPWGGDNTPPPPAIYQPYPISPTPATAVTNTDTTMTTTLPTSNMVPTPPANPVAPINTGQQWIQN